MLQVESVSKRFRIGGRTLHAVESVSFEVKPGQTLGVVGESGSGKSTLGRVALRLLQADAGRVLFEGQDLADLGQKELRERRRDLQMIFQNPLASLNPRMTMGAAIEDALIVQKMGGSAAARRARVGDLLTRVGLPRSVRDAHPFELSGGQQQRVGIARALSLSPKLVVCDEPVSAVDVSIQVQIIDLLRELQEELGIAYVFISHNLAVVQYLSDTVLVLYLGEVVEQAPAEQLFDAPRHPYTRALIDSILRVPHSAADRRMIAPPRGEIPSPLSPPSGCPYHPRCPIATDKCQHEKPSLQKDASGRLVACHYPLAPADATASTTPRLTKVLDTTVRSASKVDT
ncbi:ABC transporter ATP-binding protein [Microlunatus elymi]|uniref:ABC transporter ATP-binding protein n=1 Tax=Microlunatus elymi TaxID=2596828 RepID=A0A516Q4W8_9ACTN|nr:ABC transporter ATP-binding protein [Microlunatus elymi]